MYYISKYIEQKLKNSHLNPRSILFITLGFVLILGSYFIISKQTYNLNFSEYPSYNFSSGIKYSSSKFITGNINDTSLNKLPDSYISLGKTYSLSYKNEVEFLNLGETSSKVSNDFNYLTLVNNKTPIQINDNFIINSSLNIIRNEKIKFYNEVLRNHFHSIINSLKYSETLKRIFTFYDSNISAAISNNIELLDNISTLINKNTSSSLEEAWSKFNDYFGDPNVNSFYKLVLIQSIAQQNEVSNINNDFETFNFYSLKPSDNKFKTFYESINVSSADNIDIRNIQASLLKNRNDSQVLGLNESKKNYDSILAKIGSQTKLTKSQDTSPVDNIDDILLWTLNPLVGNNSQKDAISVSSYMNFYNKDTLVEPSEIDKALQNYNNIYLAANNDVLLRLIYLTAYQKEIFDFYNYTSENNNNLLNNFEKLYTLIGLNNSFSTSQREDLSKIFSYLVQYIPNSDNEYLNLNLINKKKGDIIAANIFYIYDIGDDYKSIIEKDFNTTVDNLDTDSPTPVYQPVNTVRIPVLMYHRIETPPNNYTKEYYVSPEIFEQQMAYLVKNNYRSLTIEEYYNDLKEDKNPSQKSVLITFDDGTNSQYTAAYPILKKYDLKATFFLISGSLFLTNDQIKEMSKNGMSIESHTVSHSDLSKLTSSSDLQTQIGGSKAAIEAITGKDVIAIAYPYCAVNGNSVNYEINDGYLLGFSCGGAIDNRYSGRYFLSRVQILDSLDSFKDRLVGKLTLPPGYSGNY